MVSYTIFRVGLNCIQRKEQRFEPACWQRQGFSKGLVMELSEQSSYSDRMP